MIRNEDGTFWGPTSQIAKERATLLALLQGLPIAGAEGPATYQNMVGDLREIHGAETLVDTIISHVGNAEEEFLRHVRGAKALTIQLSFRTNIDGTPPVKNSPHLRFEYGRSYVNGQSDMARAFWLFRTDADTFTSDVSPASSPQSKNEKSLFWRWIDPRFWTRRGAVKLPPKKRPGAKTWEEQVVERKLSARDVQIALQGLPLFSEKDLAVLISAGQWCPIGTFSLKRAADLVCTWANGGTLPAALEK